jgi:CDP-diacylglycerol---glycerol-3-phosphate 3-phosphatidyltransferase
MIEQVQPQIPPAPPLPVSPSVINLPNLLTASRLVLAIILFGLIEVEAWLWCFWIFAAAAVTDWLDGYYARKQGLSTALGRVFDPLVDKVLICGAFIFLLGIPFDRTGVLPWMATVVVARELIINGLRTFLESQGVHFGADWLGKIKMGLQCAALIGVFLVLYLVYLAVPDDLVAWVRILRDVLIYGMLAATALSGLQYLLKAAFIMREKK